MMLIEGIDQYLIVWVLNVPIHLCYGSTFFGLRNLSRNDTRSSLVTCLNDFLSQKIEEWVNPLMMSRL